MYRIIYKYYANVYKYVDYSHQIDVHYRMEDYSTANVMRIISIVFIGASILSKVIVGKNKDVSKKKNIIYTILYVLTIIMLLYFLLMITFVYL